MKTAKDLKKGDVIIVKSTNCHDVEKIDITEVTKTTLRWRSGEPGTAGIPGHRLTYERFDEKFRILEHLNP